MTNGGESTPEVCVAVVRRNRAQSVTSSGASLVAAVYREKVGSLCLALETEESRTGAAEAIRALVEAIVLEPDGDELKITLKGDLAGMLSAARDSKRSPDTGETSWPK